jgi:hypothetical protein
MVDWETAMAKFLNLQGRLDCGVVGGCNRNAVSCFWADRE